MKKILLCCCMLISIGAAAQGVRISGKLLNCTDKTLELILRNGAGDTTDSITVHADGTFSYQNPNLNEPFQANLTNRKQIQIQLFIAPGYDLQIHADVKDHKTALNTIKYTGKGGRTNQYWEKLQKNRTPDTVRWIKKDLDTYIKHLLAPSKSAAIRDTIFNTDNKDPYKDHFKKSLEIDRQYSLLIALFSSYAYENKYTYPQIEAAIQKLGMEHYMKDLNNEDNLISGAFRYFISEFPAFCDIYNAYPADSLIKKEGNYSLYLTAKLFKGKVYDYIITDILTQRVSSTYKFDDMKKFTPYVLKLSTPVRERIEKKIKDREQEAANLQSGAPSPLFSLSDTSGKQHYLADFKGKVVYIDLWASWCAPCREENPFMKALYNTYKANKNIAIISIATFDAKYRKARYEIINKENMEWLQLEDTTDSFAKSYQASFIPRFIIIDKKGNIVDSDAPRPSSGNVLTDILTREINKP